MESSGQVTKTEEMMINGEGNDASRTCARWDKRIGEDGSQSGSIAENSCERDLRRKSIPSGRHLGQEYDQSRQIRHSGRSRS